MRHNNLRPLDGQAAFQELLDFFLGEDWYVVDPLGVTQVNAIAVDEIKHLFSSPWRVINWWIYTHSKKARDKRRGS